MNDVINKVPEGATHYGVSKYGNYPYYKNITESVYQFYSTIDHKWHDTTGEPLFDVKPILDYTPTVGEVCEVSVSGFQFELCEPKFIGDTYITFNNDCGVEQSHVLADCEFRAIKLEWYEDITTPVKCVVWDDETYWSSGFVHTYTKHGTFQFKTDDGESWLYAQPVNDNITLAEIEAIVRGK